MRSTSEKINNKRRESNGVINFLFMTIVSAITMFTILNFGELPEAVPVYFGLDGQFEGFIAGKYGIFVYIGIGILMALGTLLLLSNPKLMIEKLKITKVKITEENREEQYNLAKSFIKILGLEILIFFSYIQYAVVRISVRGGNTIGTSYLSFLVLIIVSYIIYSIRSRQLK